ncbi:MAG TPA: c-type cytochrome [Terriglobales bacterium]|jgi:photosynthetic reaction center cytochrome c subunit|nr:c-type cytochrome [Terriglobales bacterium]
MNRQPAPLVTSVRVASLMIIAFLAPFVCAQNPAPPKTADQAFNNIQTLKGIPADQLIPTMQFIAASLGVECDYCHVEGAFDKDDKKPKQTARKMMEMMFAINKNSFEGRREVTCYSCHRGSSRPVGIPIIPTTAEAADHNPPLKSAPVDDPNASSPAVIDPILDKYIAALGGAASLQKVTSRVEKGSADLSGKQVPIEIYAQAPDKRLSVMHTPNGDSITAYNGTVGWLSVPGRPTQWMGPGETDAARLDADLNLAVRMKQIFTDFKMRPTEKIDGHEVTVLQGLREGKPPVNFYFDPQSRLLVRMVRYSDTAVGLNPTQIDYADYRDSGGVKIPYRWTIARPRGRFTIQVDQVQQNVPIEDQKFAAPAADQKPSAPAK